MIEEELENPYLNKFYEHLKLSPQGPNPYSLNLQKYFLMKRFENEKKAQFNNKIILTDRCVLEYYEIFVKNLFDSKLMSEKDFQIYQNLYDKIVCDLKHPDFIIFLKSDIEVNLERIQKRNRECENQIDVNYIKNLHFRYEGFLNHVKDNFKTIQLIEINCNDLNEYQLFDLTIDKLKENPKFIFSNEDSN